MTTSTLPITDLSIQHAENLQQNLFLQDVIQGLSQPVKHLSSRYFYDAAGSRLFQQIMHLPEYYLTRAEHELLKTHGATIASAFAANGPFCLIDLGAGDALKTKTLLHELLGRQAEFEYVPVDISGDAITGLLETLHQEMPGLKVHGVVGDYSTALDWLNKNKPGRKVLLFLGSNIGNFTTQEQEDFIQQLRSYMQQQDMLLMGIDLHKDPDTILSAYNDAAGVTAAFNLNLLHRINRELGGNIPVDNFRHFALYDPQEGVMRSYLVSQAAQTITLQAAPGQTFHLQPWEAIHTENSCKFTLAQAEQLGARHGLRVKSVFQDKKKYFADILYQPEQ
ncbi:L-histidine N(alpha)-methyltransferase [Pontibacter sp. Tf4]|uniref:L-histidine N(alpha)-methyltransferase n=1 Tax=Pontibacter sp. Tf4 TaxID=2761620 RepID=UPI001628C6A5|nr:L-histidine N(alpha)-methyltransferase [Pontibacter sp. Tf4]MBB6610037.1 L-histidine N(alpha)-methyltransferase [Pontibacter sp. Tf4]